MSKKKHTYMLAIQTTIIVKPIIYMEVIATSAKAARKQLNQRDLVALIDANRAEVLAEAAADLSSANMSRPIIACADRADQYHTLSECDMCTSLYGDDSK